MHGIKVGAALVASRLMHVIKTRRGVKLPALFIARNKRRANCGQPAQSDRPRQAIQTQAAAIADATPLQHQHPHGELDVHIWCEQCDALAKEAIKSGGLSHDWCVELYSERVDQALSQLPEHTRRRALEVAAEIFDYRSMKSREQIARRNAQNGYCRHGITLDCCPNGCGSSADEMEAELDDLDDATKSDQT